MKRAAIIAAWAICGVLAGSLWGGLMVQAVINVPIRLLRILPFQWPDILHFVQAMRLVAPICAGSLLLWLGVIGRLPGTGKIPPST